MSNKFLVRKIDLMYLDKFCKILNENGFENEVLGKLVFDGEKTYSKNKHVWLVCIKYSTCKDVEKIDKLKNFILNS